MAKKTITIDLEHGWYAFLIFMVITVSIFYYWKFVVLPKQRLQNSQPDNS